MVEKESTSYRSDPMSEVTSPLDPGSTTFAAYWWFLQFFSGKPSIGKEKDRMALYSESSEMRRVVQLHLDGDRNSFNEEKSNITHRRGS